MVSGGGSREEKTQEQSHEASQATAPANADVASGVGTARLRMLLMGGQPPPDAVAKLVAEYPRERTSIMTVCTQTLGNGFVQQVIKAAAQQPQAQPSAQPKPAEAATPTANHDESAEKIKDSVAELNATTYAALLVAAKDDTDSKQARWQFLNVLDRCDDPLTRHKMAEKFEHLTGQSLESFIKNASWAGKRDQAQALQMISSQRDAADAKLEKLSPAQRKELTAKANAWAEQILQVTRIKDADDDDQAVKIARVLGPRTPEEIELIRAAIRRNTNQEHSIYEELDKSLSHGNEDEAVAGLSGDPVHAAIIGIANAGSDAERIKELLKGLNPTQLREANQRNIMWGPSWAAAHVAEGPDHEEIVKLAQGDKAGAEAIHITNMLKEPADGYKLTYDAEAMQRQQKTIALRSTDNVLAELESKSPEEIVAARDTWNKQAAANGTPNWDQMIEERFGKDSVEARRVLALTHGKRAEDKVLALREGMRTNDQKEIEGALESPDLKSADPTKRAKAEAERAEIEKTAREYDGRDQRVTAFMTGKDESKVQERSVDDQLAAHYKSYAETDQHSSNGFEEIRHMANREQERKDREHEAHDQNIASTELSHEGQLSTATQYYRGDTKARAKLLDNEQSNKQLGTDEADYEKKYGKPMLGKGGDRDDMNAEELKIDNVRKYGVASERRAETELRLQKELAQTQHSDRLAQEEARRQFLGGNAGTEDLVREQVAVEDSMLTEGKGPFGMGRELKEGTTKDEFLQVDQNLTKSLETQREEKIRLSNHLAHIFSTIAKLGALLTMQPELFVLIDVCSGMAEMAIKKSVAGEAYDPADDAKLLAIDAVVDIAMLGAAKLAEARKLGALGKDAVVASEEAGAVGDKVATKAIENTTEEGAEKTIVAEAKNEAVEGGATEAGVPHEAGSSAPGMKPAAAAEVDANAVKDVESGMKGAKPAPPVIEGPKELAGEIEGVKSIEKGPHWDRLSEQERAARDAAPVTKVKGVTQDGTFTVRSQYEARTFEAADGKVTELSINVHMRPGEAISDIEVQRMKTHARQGLDKFYNFDKAGGRLHTLPDGSKLHVRVEFVENPADADLVVDIKNSFNPMNRQRLETNQNTWRMYDAGDNMAAHELSHQLGLLDEYEDLRRSPFRRTYKDNSLLADFHAEGSEKASIKPRHVEQLGKDVDAARSRATMRPTEPMPSVQAPPIDEAKAAAETQRIPIQTTEAEAQATKASEVAPEMPRYGSVEIADAKNAELGELDIVDHDGLPTDRFIEKKDGRGLKHPRNQLTPDEWAQDQILNKTTTRIQALEHPDATSRVGNLAPAGTSSVPDIQQLRSIKQFVFQVASTDPDLKAAVDKAVKDLEALYGPKGYKFSAVFGVTL